MSARNADWKDTQGRHSGHHSPKKSGAVVPPRGCYVEPIEGPDSGNAHTLVLVTATEDSRPVWPFEPEC